jgi:hypothetical protein
MKKSNYFWIVIIFLFIILFEFKNLFLNVSDSFIDWGDTPFIAWQIFITREKFLSLNFSDFFTTNSHYPFKNSLFFTDTFIGQAILGIPLFFIKNPVLLHNLIFLITIFLNYIVIFFLFKRITSSPLGGVLGSIFINNSFYFFDQIIHLQTLSYWPMILILHLLFVQKEKQFNSIKLSFFTGLLSAIQFYFSVYLAIFSIFSIILFYFIFLIIDLILKKTFLFFLVKRVFLSLIVVGIVFLIFSYPLINGYLEFHKTHHQIRDINEILLNNGHLTDYLFFLPNTFFSNLSIVKKYNRFDRFAPEKAYFPGFVITLGAFLGLFFQRVKKKLNNFEVVNQYSFEGIFFIFLIITGFIFSLGPRLMAGGRYLEIPLPYLFFLKQFNFLHSIRLTHRWSFFLLIGLSYFASNFYKNFKNKYGILLLILLFFYLEAIPKIEVKRMTYLTSAYQFLKEKNNRHKVLLEYPFLNLEKGVDISVETRRLLASTYHKMILFNGYTGIFINDYGTIRLLMENFFPNDEIKAILEALQIDYLKLDKKFLTNQVIERAKIIFSKPVYEDTDSLIFNIKSLQKIADLKTIRVSFCKNYFYGSDNKLYINICFKNASNLYFSNINQNKLILHLSFYKRNKLIKKKEIYQLYPLIMGPNSLKEKEIQLYEKINFDKLRIDVLDGYKKIIISQIH